eukprot:TRINITY_DN9147_c0_g1_i8.p2 TRINITY_DN9147_c0_g1~~TRINITY_DN9147_c0_g1_i8.p2  ORF type:complete len:136 (+),score=42.73 TRINITY_DN9147_c0_g1_i8:165-572(+)
MCIRDRYQRRVHGILHNMDTSKKYLTEKLNPILEPLVAECLQECPKDPAAFILEWIKKKYPRLAKPIPKLEKKEEAGSEDESSEEDEEDISEIPAMSQRSSVARKAISAEAYGTCLLYTSPSPRDLSTSRMPSSA